MVKAKRFIEYVPPKPEFIRSYAHEVCELLAERTRDSIFVQPHVVRGLAEFLELAEQVRAKYLNEEQLVDKDAK